MHPTEALYLKYDSRQGITEIIGIHKKYLVKCKPIDIIDFWCLSCGTSIEGSHSAFRHHLAITQKLPVLVNPVKLIFFFPTTSVRNMDCIWINSNQIKGIENSAETTKILFYCGRYLVSDVSARSLKLQVKRCRDLSGIIRRHHEHDLIELPFFLAEQS